MLCYYDIELRLRNGIISVKQKIQMEFLFLVGKLLKKNFVFRSQKLPRKIGAGLQPSKMNETWH